MSDVNNREKILKIIAEQLEISENDISSELSLAELGVSSLDMVDIAMSLEDEFLVELPDSVPQNIKNVSDIIFLLEKLIDKRKNLNIII